MFLVSNASQVGLPARPFTLPLLWPLTALLASTSMKLGLGFIAVLRLSVATIALSCSRALLLVRFSFSIRLCMLIWILLVVFTDSSSSPRLSLLILWLAPSSPLIDEPLSEALAAMRRLGRLLYGMYI